MKKIFLIAALLIMLPLGAFAQQADQAQAAKKQITYYYADWCPHCQKVNKFFTENGIYEKYDVVKLNFDDPMNKVSLTNLFEKNGYGGQAGIPAIVIDGKLITGDVPIIDYFRPSSPSLIEKITNYLKNFFASPLVMNAKSSAGNSLTIFALVAAAFVDASNPCALAVLILLLATVSNAKGKNQALFAGFMFSLAVFTSYLLMGLGLYKAITVFNIPKYLSLAVGILAIILALANFKDVFWYGKWFIMEVPLSWRPKMQEFIKKVTSPFGALGVGFIVSLFLVPCSSGPYVVILGMLAQRVEMAKSITLLVLYNFIFVLPMILITLGMYFFNAKMGKLEKWRKDNLRVLHAIAGSVMFFIGLYLIYSRL